MLSASDRFVIGRTSKLPHKYSIAVQVMTDKYCIFIIIMCILVQLKPFDSFPGQRTSLKRVRIGRSEYVKLVQHNEKLQLYSTY